MLVSTPFAKSDFTQQFCAFDTSTTIQFYSSLLNTPASLQKLFFAVHYRGITPSAAQSGLLGSPETTPMTGQSLLLTSIIINTAY
jgi:hypothetical protein